MYQGTPSTAPLHNKTGNGYVEWSPQSVLSVVGVSLLFVLTVFGNVLVIVAIAKYKRLQIPSNYILVNLAAADISVALLAPWVLVAELKGVLFQDVYVCILPYCLVTLGCGASLVSLGLVAYDRYAALVKSLMYHQYITTRRVQCLSLVIWVYVSCVAFSPMAVNYFLASRPGVVCSLHRLNKHVALVQTIMIFAPSCVVMGFCYCRVMLVARHHSRAISAIQLSLFPNSLNKTFHMFKGSKYSRTLLIILGVFCLTWVTFAVTLLLGYCCESCSSAVPLYKYSAFLVFANSCLNPWIYAHRNQDFKAAFSRLLYRIVCRTKRQHPSDGTGGGRRNSRVSVALSRTNSMVGGFQHLHILYNNADVVPETAVIEETKMVRVAPRLILHDMTTQPVVECFEHDTFNV